MSYDAIREYLVTLKLQPGVKIVWGEIDPARISAVNHDQLAAADAVATSLYYAVCLDRFGEVEQSHAKVLEKRFYRHNDKIQGYGLKFFPDFDLIKAQNPHLAGLV
jgi:hypothetical protein